MTTARRSVRRPQRSITQRFGALRIGALLLAAFAAMVGWQALRDWRRAPGANAILTRYEVDGLDCPVWCSVRLSEGIDALDGARVESIDRERGVVTIARDPARQSDAALRSLLTARGFPVRSGRDAASR